jgi:NAD(P)-dependent dehydrogenase (short-subunit alcohol dehydrogenase family)
MPAAIVTGGASGIGRATAQLLARDGWKVAVTDRDAAGAKRVADEIGAAAFGLDVADEADVDRVFDAALNELGSLDGLVTAAGIVDTTPFMDVSVASFRKIYDVNVIGTFLCIREAAKRMPRGARIVTVSSVAGKRGGGLSGTAAYAASKGGVIALTRNAARSLAERGIAVNSIAPGSTSTAMLAPSIERADHKARIEGISLLNRIADPAEIAEAIVWLLSSKASYVAGETLTVDGGLMLD